MRKMWSHAAGRLISGLANSLYPASCPSCSAASDSFTYAPFCHQCWSKIRGNSSSACLICATPFASDTWGICAECRRDPPAFSRAMSYGIYDKILATAIHTFKFQKTRRLYKPLGRLLTEFDLAGIDAIIPVPLSQRGLRERGFNQSLLLAKVLSDSSRIPLMMNGLRKDIETPVQIGLSKKERAANLRGAFTATASFTGMQLLLVDDVMTTGATARECSTVLLEAGAEDVVVLTLARASTL